jgi:hypothetical protein
MTKMERLTERGVCEDLDDEVDVERVEHKRGFELVFGIGVIHE